MTPALAAFVLADLVCVLTAARRLFRKPRIRAAATHAHAADSDTEAWLRIDGTGGHPLDPNTQARIRIAPTRAVALDVRGEAGQTAMRFAVDDLAAVRIWVAGRPVHSVRLAGLGTAQLRPLTDHGWELAIETTGGRVARCYGPELGRAVSEDLARLRRMTQAAASVRALRMPWSVPAPASSARFAQ